MSEPIDWEQWHRDQARGSWPAEYMVRLVKAHRATLKPGTMPPAMDIGCGAGAHVRLLSSEGYMVTATDISPMACRRTQEAYLFMTVLCGDINTMPAIGQFDLILDNLTLTHVEKPNWQRIMGFLKPGGTFITAQFIVEDEALPQSWNHMADVVCRGAKLVETIEHNRNDPKLNYCIGVAVLKKEA